MSSVDKQTTAALLIVGGGGLVIFSQAAFQSLPEKNQLVALAFTLVGFILFIFGVISIQRDELPRWISHPINSISKFFNIEQWQSGLLLLAIAYALLVPFAAGDSSKMNNTVVALTAWLLASGGIIVGGSRGKFRIAPPKLQSLIIPATLFVLALFVRAILTERIPIYLSGDEGSAGVEATLFLNGAKNNIFNIGWFGFPSLYFFIQSLSIRVIGQTTEALRIPSAIAGSLTVLSLYFVGKSMFDRRTALLAAIFLAGFHFHIHFSRIGLNNIWDGMWYVLAIGALVYGWEKEDRLAYLLAGFSLGFSQYFYPSSRTLFGLAFAWILIAPFINWEKFKRSISHFAIMFLVAFVIFLPLGWVYAKHIQDYLAPMTRVSILGNWLALEMQNTGLPAWRVILNQISLGAGGYITTPLRGAWYTPGTPLLRTYSSGIFLLGLGLLVIKWRESRSVLLALWVLMFVIIGGLSESTPAAQRYVAVAPACALLLGYGLSGTLEILERIWPQRIKIFSSIALALVVFLAADDAYFYFFKYIPKQTRDQARSNGVIAQELANFLKNKDPQWQVVFLGSPAMGYYSINSTRYLNPEITGIDINHPWGDPENPLPSSDKLIFVFLPHHYDEIAAVQTDFPGGSESEKIAADGQSLFRVYEYSKGMP